MLHVLISASLLIPFLWASLQQPVTPKPLTKTETFAWKYKGMDFGTLEVPSGYTSETWNYREGIVTTLRYLDGSSIVLQRGSMYIIPMFRAPEHLLDSEEGAEGKIIRRGHFRDGSKTWAEVNYRDIKRTHKPKSMFEAVLPNLGYEYVPRERADEFMRALLSYAPQ